MQRRILFVCTQAVQNQLSKILKEKGRIKNSAGSLECTTVTADQVKKKMLAKNVNEIVYVGAPEEKTGYITKYISLEMNNSRPKFFGVNLVPSGKKIPIDGIELVERRHSLEEVLA